MNATDTDVLDSATTATRSAATGSTGDDDGCRLRAPIVAAVDDG